MWGKKMEETSLRVMKRMEAGGLDGQCLEGFWTSGLKGHHISAQHFIRPEPAPPLRLASNPNDPGDKLGSFVSGRITMLIWLLNRPLDAALLVFSFVCLGCFHRFLRR